MWCVGFCSVFIICTFEDRTFVCWGRPWVAKMDHRWEIVDAEVADLTGFTSIHLEWRPLAPKACVPSRDQHSPHADMTRNDQAIPREVWRPQQANVESSGILFTTFHFPLKSLVQSRPPHN